MSVQAVTSDAVELPLATLSPRESQVLEMAAAGLTNRQIALQLHVTVHAVKFHLAGIYRKLGVGNRTEAAVVYLRGTDASLRSHETKHDA